MNAHLKDILDLLDELYIESNDSSKYPENLQLIGDSFRDEYLPYILESYHKYKLTK